jgi:hypothetical protein
MEGKHCWANRRPRLFIGPVDAGPVIYTTLPCTGEDAYTPRISCHSMQKNCESVCSLPAYISQVEGLLPTLAFNRCSGHSHNRAMADALGQ